MPETGETYQPMALDATRVGLTSPEKVLEQPHGEVKKSETINYRTLEPEKDGLFCERIFGPSKDWECHCNKYKEIRYKGVVCDRCGVEVIKASVRREHTGHIQLAIPVSHIWYFKGAPSRMSLILDISPRTLEKVLYFTSYIILDVDGIGLQYKQMSSEKEYREEIDKYGYDTFHVGMGAEAIQELLQAIDLEKDPEELRKTLKEFTGQKRTRIIKRLEVVGAFRSSGNEPEWMIVIVVPVIPPDTRPMVQLDGGRFATSDLNNLCRRIINRNNRLARLLELGVSDIIVRNRKRMSQETVDILIDNGRRGRPVTGPGNCALKSLSNMLKGRRGRFRQNLLRKRVDYSGRFVIVMGPELKIYQCGLPKKITIKLSKPFVTKEPVSNGAVHNIKSAKEMVERLQSEVWDVLEEVVKEHPVMLNRAPTLHRPGIQAFESILVEGKAIKLRPLVCTAFNADFDGGQMAVHLPLSAEIQAEYQSLLLSSNNLLKPPDDGPVAVPSQGMVLGIYCLTQERSGTKDEGMIFKSVNEAVPAYENGATTLHSRIKVRMQKTMPDGAVKSGIIKSTVGRFIFNGIIPQDLGFANRSILGNELLLKVDFHVGKKQCKQTLEKVINIYGTSQTVEALDDIEAIGYKYSTKAVMTISISDMTVPESKPQLIANAQEIIDRVAKNFRRGLITEEGRYKEVTETWKNTDDQLAHDLLTGLDKYNSIFMMADSSVHGPDKQIKQLAGIRGLMADTTGHTIKLPTKSDFREGLNVLEYFISAYGARKELSDTALRTADSGYLTRRLVDVSQDLIIREVDYCEGKDVPFTEVKAFVDDRETIESLEERLTGRYIAEIIADPDTGEVVVKANHMCTPKHAVAVMKVLNKLGHDSMKTHTVLSCKSHIGVCAKYHGVNMTTGQAVQIGEAVGIITAQSIGEPGTQLTMRTFRTGGVTGGDTTQGFPRMEELLEARKSKSLAIIAEFDGVVNIGNTKKERGIVVTNNETGNSKTYLVPYGSRIKVTEGQVLEAGSELTEGSVNPHDILGIEGAHAAQDYVIQEVQRAYHLQGVEINDKHIGVTVRQTLKEIRIEESGNSNVLPGVSMDVLDYSDMNEALIAEDKEPVEGKQVVLGITKTFLATDSFLSAASFQKATKVLTKAATNGKVGNLIGLKENVIISKLIPVGTDMKRYRNVKLDTDITMKDEILFSDKDEVILPEEQMMEVGEALDFDDTSDEM